MNIDVKFKFEFSPRIETLQDLISISLVPLNVIPLLLGMIMQNNVFLTIVGGAFGVTYSTSIIKGIFGKLTKNRLFYRPPGAKYCTILNNACDPAAPAFPSGHVATATFLVTTITWELNNELERLQIGSKYVRRLITNVLMCSSVIYIILMGYSRHAKLCHNWFQVFGGFLYGGLCALGFIWLCKQYF
jgi:membrane-associated phospholipid phosphatase